MEKKNESFNTKEAMGVKPGDKLIAVKDCPGWFTEGKEYEIYSVSEDGVKLFDDYKNLSYIYSPLKFGFVLKSQVDHPQHYGGKDNPHEAINFIEAHNMNFNLGNVIKYVTRAGKKDDAKQDLEKAAWYLNREIEKLT